MGKSKLALSIVVLIIIPFILFACSGGSGSGSGVGESSSMGTVAVLIQDAPTEEYKSIVLCISEATLEPASIILFESDSCVPIDLLDHQEKPFLLTVKDIPAGTYDQIRLKVDYIDTEGGSCDDEYIKIPSGQVKINPQRPIEIKSGDKIAINIDIHAKRSINLHPAGKSEKCIFRPVILAEIKNLGQIPSKDKCPRILKGTIVSINEVEGEINGFKLSLLHDPENNIDIRVDENTIVFDENGDFTTPEALEVGQKVKVRGEIQEDATILSSFIAIGELFILHGTALTSLEANNGDLKFELGLDPFQAITDDSINVIVKNQTFILIDCNTEVTGDAIKPGVGVRAIGKLSEGNLVAVVCFLEKQQNFGTIIAMTDTGYGYDVEFIPSGETESVIIFLPLDAEVELDGDGGIEKDLLAELVNCNPRKGRITLSEDNSNEADLIEVQDEVIEGTIDTVDPDFKTITLKDGTVIQVQNQATILRDGTELINFSELEENEAIRVFGLEACSEDSVDFYGFVIVVMDNNDI